MNLFNIMAALMLNTDDYDKNIDKSAEKASGFGGKLKGALGTAGKVAGVTLACVSADNGNFLTLSYG